MIAICGIIQSSGRPVHPDTLRPILIEMSDYGRDGTYYWQDGRVALGNQMTWQTPESKRETPPQFDARAGLAITADARIDNRNDLCGALGIAHTGKTLTDSQLILRAYRKWGTNCPEKLLGDFAFAIWDGRRRRLFCARDILGTRPFYYHQTDRRVLFASDIAALRAAPGVTDALDLPYLSAHCRHAGNYPHDTHTFYRDIQKLARAHAMTVGAGHLTHRIKGWATAGRRMGISYAYPLLDWRIVEFAIGLPPQMFFKNGWKRFLFRHALRGILPDDVRWARNKKEPALNDYRDRIRDMTIERLPRIIAEQIKARDGYRVLDASSALHAADEVLSRQPNLHWRPGDPPDKRMDLWVNLQSAFAVEMMVNPKLEQDAKDCLRCLSAEGSPGKRQMAA